MKSPDNSGQLTQYAARCEALLKNWDDISAEQLLDEVMTTYNFLLCANDIKERIIEIHKQLMFALKYL